MDAHIEGCLLQLTSLTQDLPAFAEDLSPTQFNWRVSPDRWSIGQCIEHLNITTERYLPVLSQQIASAKSRGRTAPRPFTMGLLERGFFWTIEPPARMRVNAPKAFHAPADLQVDSTVARWRSLHDQLAECIRSADGVDLGGVKVKSQFGPLSFTLGGTFSILLAHERRHTWQARGVLNAAGFPRA